MKDVQLSTLWKLIEIASAVQVVNATIDVALWILNGIEVPAWALALSVIWYTVLIFALKQAITDEKNRPRIENASPPHSPQTHTTRLSLSNLQN